MTANWSGPSIPFRSRANPITARWAGDSWKQRSGVNVWGLMTVDAQRGIVYMPFGAPSGDLFGGDRPGNNLYGTSIVAADARTGKYLWHFQVVHHDIWDFDLESPPVLLDVKQGGKTIPAVAVFGKSSLLFLLDRVTGKPIYDVEERPVAPAMCPASRCRRRSPSRSNRRRSRGTTFTMDDIATVTPEMEAACRKLITDNNIDSWDRPYAPPTYNRIRDDLPQRNRRLRLGRWRRSIPLRTAVHQCQ